MTRNVKGLIMITDQKERYFLEEIGTNDPKVRVYNILATLGNKGPFLEGKDMFGGVHFVNIEHIAEIYVGEYSLPESENR